MRADRVRFAPYGLFGGKPAGTSSNVFNPYGANTGLEAKVKNRPIRRGDVVRHILAGGGGYGWPFERAAQKVIEDVRDGKVTLLAARDVYGVVIHPDTLKLDEAETARLRAALRAAVDVNNPPLYTQ
jgi:N-methylhydantoinase B